jgi:hypothetical protein
MLSRTIVTCIVCSLLAAVVALGLPQVVEASGNIDPLNKWVWGTNVGWLNFNPTDGGVTVCADHLEGYAWAENIGWIRLGTVNGCAAHVYSNDSITDYGVNKDLVGNLSGNAWSTNAGWIKFDPTNGGVTINSTTGSFDGYAWAENVGWIHFKGSGSVPYNVVMRLVPTATATPTATPSVTQTFTATPTNTVSPTFTYTFTTTPTRTPTPSVTHTFTLTPTNTASPTFSRTVTGTPTPTVAILHPGDFNCDAVISAADLPALVQLLPSGEPDSCGGDLTDDGKLDENDVGALIEEIFGDAGT